MKFNVLIYSLVFFIVIMIEFLNILNVYFFFDLLFGVDVLILFLSVMVFVNLFKIDKVCRY